MKKIICIVSVLLIIALLFTGCMSQEEKLSAEVISLQDEKSALQSEIAQLEEQIASLNEVVISKKVETDTAKYIVSLKIKQVHYSLDFTEHIKDSLNELTIQIPVDKEYYNEVEIGDVIDDSFRFGSLLAKGSAGKWKITVENKEIQ